MRITAAIGLVAVGTVRGSVCSQEQASANSAIDNYSESVPVDQFAEAVIPIWRHPFPVTNVWTHTLRRCMSAGPAAVKILFSALLGPNERCTVQA